MIDDQPIIRTGPHHDDDPATIEYARDGEAITLNAWVGHDGVTVVQIDTTQNPGRLRINLNDFILWDGDPNADEPPGAHHGASIRAGEGS